MEENPRPAPVGKRYDLDERCFLFARRVRGLVARLQPTAANLEDSRQVLKSSGSVGANYIETNEALSKKDFVMRVKISRKEAKESWFWLRLLEAGDVSVERERQSLFGFVLNFDI